MFPVNNCTYCLLTIAKVQISKISDIATQIATILSTDKRGSHALSTSLSFPGMEKILLFNLTAKIPTQRSWPEAIDLGEGREARKVNSDMNLSMEISVPS